ncbi:MAG: DUF3486 family protein [Rhizobiaceae bacterium]
MASAKKNNRRRKGRGRLSAMEQLPYACDEIIAWASNELRDRDRTQTEIYEEFNTKLETLQKEHRGELEFTIPSFSAFNRYSINLAALTRRLEQTREIAAAISKRFDAEASDDLTLIAAEAIKTLVFELLTMSGEGGVDPKGAMQLAAALRNATQAQSVSTARRDKIDKQFTDQVEEAVEIAVKEGGLSAKAAEEIIDKILSVPKK